MPFTPSPAVLSTLDIPILRPPFLSNQKFLPEGKKKTKEVQTQASTGVRNPSSEALSPIGWPREYGTGVLMWPQPGLGLLSQDKT